MAEKLSISNKTISKWETGKCMPDYSIIQSLCIELEISIAELMDGEEQGEKSIRVYDEEQTLDLMGKIRKFENQNIILLYLIFSIIVGGVADDIRDLSAPLEIVGILLNFVLVIAAVKAVLYAFKSFISFKKEK